MRENRIQSEKEGTKLKKKKPPAQTYALKTKKK